MTKPVKQESNARDGDSQRSGPSARRRRRPKDRRGPKGDGSIFQRKDGRWQGFILSGYSADGKAKRRYFSAATEEEAVQKKHELIAKNHLGLLNPTTTTVAEYLEAWLNAKARNVKPRTERYYRYHVEKHILPQLGGQRLRDLTSSQLRAFIAQVADTVSANEANKTRQTLTCALRDAAFEDLIHSNPAQRVRKLREEPSEREFLWTADQIRAFLAVATEHRLGAAFHLALATGLRHGEVLGVRWKDIDSGQLRVSQVIVHFGADLTLSTPKTSASRRLIPLDPGTLALLEARRHLQNEEREKTAPLWGSPSPEFQDLVFTNELGGPLHPRNFDRVWYRLQQKAGVPRRRFHDLRHMYTSMMAAKGFDPTLVSSLLGHTDPSFTLRRYSHAFESQRQRAAVPLDELLEAIDGAEPDGVA